MKIEPSNGVMDHRKAERWSNGVIEYCGTPPLHHSTTPSRQLSPTLRLAGRLLIGAGLLAVTLTGCGPSSDKAGKPSGTNGAAPQTLAKKIPAPTARPGGITNLAPANSLAAARTNAAARIAAQVKAARPPGDPSPRPMPRQP